MTVMLCSGVLPKPMPGSSTILLARDAGARRDLERAGEERHHVGHDVDAGIGVVAVVHHDDRHAVLGGHARHVRIALQAPDVVDDRGALVERPGGDLRLDGVDRDRQAELARPRARPAQAAPVRLRPIPAAAPP